MQQNLPVFTSVEFPIREFVSISMCTVKEEMHAPVTVKGVKGEL